MFGISPAARGHSIQGIGSSECHFILIFDNGDFSEVDHTLSITDWLASTSPAVVAQSLGLGVEWVAKLPKGEAYFAGGPTPDDPFAHAAPRAKPTLLTTHRYPSATPVAASCACCSDSTMGTTIRTTSTHG